MHMKLKLMLRYTMLAAVMYGTGASVVQAAIISYAVTLNTSTLIGHPAGPFSLAFQLTDGSTLGDVNNVVTLSSFAFSEGSAVGAGTTFGGTSGSISSGVSITDSSFLNFFIQQFNPGGQVSFTVSVTNNMDAGGMPDQFSFSILDRSGQELPTQAGVPFFNPFLVLTIDSLNPTLQTFASDSSRSPGAGGTALTLTQPTVTSGPVSVPEPPMAAIGGYCFVLLCVLSHRAKAGESKSSSTDEIR